MLLNGVLAASCAAARVQLTSAPPVDWRSLEVQPAADTSSERATEKERAAAELYLKAIASSDSAQLAAMLDEDSHFAFGDSDTRGRDRVVQAHQQLFGAFDEKRFAPSRVLRTDRSQSIEWTMAGVHSRAWMGIAPTQKPVAIRGVTLLFTNDDGSLSDVHVYFDPAVVQAQLGAGPAELRSSPPPALPTGPVELFEQRGTPEEAANVKLLRGMLQALEDNQEAAYLSAFASDVEVLTADRPQPVRGREALERLFKSMRRAIGDLDTVVQNAWGVRQFAIVEYSIAGLQLARLGRLSFVPNRLFSTRVVDIAEVQGGKIVRLWRYDDSGSLEPK